jgi:hypothetical protein
MATSQYINPSWNNQSTRTQVSLHQTGALTPTTNNIPEEQQAEIPQPHTQHDGDEHTFSESRKSNKPITASAEEQRRQRISRQQEKCSLPTSPQPPSIKGNSNPSHVFDESLKECFLKNIKREICHDAPLLIKEKLKIWFSDFISELSGTMDSFPGTILESCVVKLSATINPSV